VVALSVKVPKERHTKVPKKNIAKFFIEFYFDFEEMFFRMGLDFGLFKRAK
jgi:hypothetical protein